MKDQQLQNALTFIKTCEKLKNTLHTAYSSTGRQESTAEHTWRLCLMAMVFEKELGNIDFAKLLKICIIHDLGEAVSGDIAAVDQVTGNNKAIQERADFRQLLVTLEADQQAELLALWDKYDQASSIEAKLVKGLDKLETIIQHNQGKNPADFDYHFNLTYGQQYMANHPLFTAIRALVDRETAEHAKHTKLNKPSKNL